MRGATSSSLQLSFHDQFYFPPDRVIAAGIYYRKAASLIGKGRGQVRFPAGLVLPRVSWRRRKRQVAAYLAVTHGGFSQSEVANFLGLSRNSVWHGCRTIENWRDDDRVRFFLRRLESRLDGMQEQSQEVPKQSQQKCEAITSDFCVRDIATNQKGDPL